MISFIKSSSVRDIYLNIYGWNDKKFALKCFWKKYFRGIDKIIMVEWVFLKFSKVKI